MVKLIRLMSDGDGVFKSAFENDIIIKEQSKMALLNLTFKTDVDALTLNQNNNIILTQSDQENTETLGTTRMEPVTYRRSNIHELATDLMNSLNNSLTIHSPPTGTEENDISSMFAIYGGDAMGDAGEGPFEIQQRYCPFLNPLIGGVGGNRPNQPKEPSARRINKMEVNHTGAGGQIILTELSKTAAATASVDSLDRVEGITEHYFSRGSGLLTLRIKDSVTNGSGLQDNGGCLGLTNLDLSSLEDDDEIPLANIMVQLRCNRPLETYKFITNGGVEQDSGILPQQVAMLAHPTLADHDILFIQKSGKNYEFGVFQMVAAVATKQVFGTIPVKYIGTGESNQFDQPYMTCRGAKVNIVFDSYNYSIDPWIDEPPGTPKGANDEWEIIPNNGISGFNNGYRASLAGNLGSVISTIFAEPNNGRWGNTYSASITMHSDIWHSLGFTQVPNTDDYETEYEPIAPNQDFPNAATWTATTEGELIASDNYIVISDTLTLDSYDASEYEYGKWDGNSIAGGEKRGRRQNILMTIPVNDNTNGLVEFQTNTPIFIDINNAKNHNVRNLNFRILKKDFTPIYSRQATMTILIED